MSTSRSAPASTNATLQPSRASNRPSATSSVRWRRTRANASALTIGALRKAMHWPLTSRRCGGFAAAPGGPNLYTSVLSNAACSACSTVPPVTKRWR